MSKPLDTHPYLAVHDWSDHQSETTSTWIRNYTALLNNPRYCRLSLGARGLLHGAWLARARTGLHLEWGPAGVALGINCPRTRHLLGQLKELITQGFLVPTRTRRPRKIKNGETPFNKDGRGRARVLTSERNEKKGEEIGHVAGSAAADPPAFTVRSAAGRVVLGIRQAKLKAWQAAFPSVDIQAESKRAEAWLAENPKRVRSQRGMSQFLTNWFSRTQERANNLSGGVQEPRKQREPTDAELKATILETRKEQETGRG